MSNGCIRVSVQNREIVHDAPSANPVLGPAVSRLMLTNFRSYAGLTLDCGPQGVVLTGPNGAGKTNILEALSMLAPGRSLRGASLTQVSRRAAGEDEEGPGAPWAVSATVQSANGPVQVGAGYMPGTEPTAQKRVLRLDGVTVGSAAALSDHLPLVWLTPAQDRLFLDGASDRRRFFDRLIAGFDPRHTGLWSAYEKAMRERLALLKAGCRDAAWLTSVERIMAETGVALAASRLDGVAHLAAELADDGAFGTFPAADLSLGGEVEADLAASPAIHAEDQFADRLAASRALDAEQGRTRHGPHSTDLIVRHRAKGRDARHCSTGEQKSLMIRLVLAGSALASRRTRSTPVLLLDEIAAHLDDARRRSLFDAIARLGVQAWYTGTDERPFDALGARARAFHVFNGNVSPISAS